MYTYKLPGKIFYGNFFTHTDIANFKHGHDECIGKVSHCLDGKNVINNLRLTCILIDYIIHCAYHITAQCKITFHMQ